MRGDPEVFRLYPGAYSPELSARRLSKAPQPHSNKSALRFIRVWALDTTLLFRFGRWKRLFSLVFVRLNSSPLD